MLARLPRILDGLYTSADAASAPVIGLTTSEVADHGLVTLGNYAWYEPLWFMQLTHDLPYYREIWELAPVFATFIAYAIIVWLALRTVGPRAAVLTAALLACVTLELRVLLFTLNSHGLLALHAAVLLASLVVLVRSTRWQRTLRMVALGVPLTLFTAVGLAGDKLLAVAGLAPFVLTALWSWWRTGARSERTIAVFALASSLAAAVIALLAVDAGRADGVVDSPLGISFVSPGKIVSNVEILLDAFSFVGGGRFLGAPAEVGSLRAVVAGLLTLAALALVLHRLWRLAPALAARRPGTGVSLARETYVVFWAIAVVAGIVAFVMSSVPVDAGTARYLIVVWVGVVALLPVLVATGGARQRLALVAAVSVFAAISLYDVANPPGASSVAADVERFVTAQGATTGYGVYDDAAPITWASHDRIRVYPVCTCAPPSQAKFPFASHTVQSWYRPQPGRRTFLLQNPARSFPVLPDPADGKPIARRTFGTVTVLVYDHDIATTIKPG